jgi:transcription elongation GreA/GreB family factor
VKEKLLKSFLALVEKDLAGAKAAAKAAVESATGEESKPENQYDTRALEASYLAAGQNARALELGHAVKNLRELPLRSYSGGVPIGAGALVEIDCEGDLFTYFVLPGGAGLSAQEGGRKIQVLTPDSPLGKIVLGKTEGATFDFMRAGSRKEYEILKVE